MKILLAADGSPFTKKALAFLVTHEGLASARDELVVLHVQPPIPPRVTTMVGGDEIATYHRTMYVFVMCVAFCSALHGVVDIGERVRLRCIGRIRNGNGHVIRLSKIQQLRFDVV